MLLLDSDAELRDPEHVRQMDRDLDRPGVFGAGFTQGPNRIPDHWSPPAGLVLHMERPWIPCTMLAVAPVQAALADGRSFLPRFVPNEAGSRRPRLSAFLAARWGPPWAPPSRALRGAAGTAAPADPHVDAAVADPAARPLLLLAAAGDGLLRHRGRRVRAPPDRARPRVRRSSRRAARRRGPPLLRSVAGARGRSFRGRRRAGGDRRRGRRRTSGRPTATSGTGRVRRPWTTAPPTSSTPTSSC